MKNDYDGGEAILEAFRNLDVDYVISSPGSEWPSFWEAMARQKHSGMAGPTYLNCAHETIAVTIAAAYTNITGRMQAVLLHAGAGLLQGSMAVGAARAMETPMLVMSGGARLWRSGLRSRLAVVPQPGGSGRAAATARAGGEVGAGQTHPRRSIRRSCAGEMAQRTPGGLPTSASRWNHVARVGAAEDMQSPPGAPPQAADIDNAVPLAQAKCPVISVSADPAGRHSTRWWSLPTPWRSRWSRAPAPLRRFPKSRLISANIPTAQRIDVALLIESRGIRRARTQNARKTPPLSRSARRSDPWSTRPWRPDIISRATSR